MPNTSKMPDSTIARQTPARASSLPRWTVLCIASILLHVLAIEWAGGHIRLPSLRQHGDAVMVAVLHPAPAPRPDPVSEPARPAVPKPKPKPRPKPRRSPAPPSAAPVEVAPATFALADTDTAAPPFESDYAGMEAPGTSVETALPLAGPGEAKQAEEAIARDTSAATPAKIDPPPSVTLQYDVQTTPHEGNPMYGHGTITWQNSGNAYAINGDAGILFINALTFSSEGSIDASGITPTLYSEKRFRRPETNTHFQRERNIISFSASTASYPRQGGEQDRASIIWQLAGIGRGDSGKFAPGAQIEIFVAGVRDGETWRIRVIGQEQIDTGVGQLSAWHVVRAPRPGSYDQQLDIWLAPQHEWYPVKLRYTETNGDCLDMSLSAINIAAAH